MNRIIKTMSLVALVFLSGCSSGLKGWVEERGYTYYPDYSTKNILGDEVAGDIPQKNPVFNVKGARSEVPGLVKTDKRTFKVEGSIESEEFLKYITNGSIKGDFSSVSEVEIELKNPFKEEAEYFVPTAACNGRKMLVVTNVLNTGDMRIEVRDKKGAKITAQFAVEKTGKAGVSLEYNPRDGKTTLSGRNFYAGYIARHKRCANMAQKEVKIRRGEYFSDDNIGMHAHILDIRRVGSEKQALMYIAPSRFLSMQAALEEALERESEIIKAKKALEELKDGISMARLNEESLLDEINEAKKESLLAKKELKAFVTAFEAPEKKQVYAWKGSKAPEKKKTYMGSAVEVVKGGPVPDALAAKEAEEAPEPVVILEAGPFEKAGEELALKAEEIDNILDPWKKAPNHPEETPIWSKDPASVILKPYKFVGIPGIPGETGLYIETKSVTDDEVVMRIQHIRYEDD